MAIKKSVQGKAPAKAEKPAKSGAEKTAKAEILGTSANVKLTVSVKRRLGNGDEVFFAPGMELTVAPEDFDAAKAQVTNTIEAWISELTAKFPDPADAEDDADDDSDDDDSDDDDEEDEDEDDEAEGDDLTEDDVKGMSKKDLLALIKEQELEIDGAAKMGVKELREAVLEALFSDDEDEDEDDEDDDDEEDDEDEDDEDSDDDDDEEDSELYTEAELKAMKLSELQEIVDEWKIKHPKYDKAAKAKDKIAIYIKHILKHQED